jgi:hypothetical protein
MLVYRHCGPFMPQADLVSALSALAMTPDESSISSFGDSLPETLRRQAVCLAINLERLGHLVLDRGEKYSANSRFAKTASRLSGLAA